MRWFISPKLTLTTVSKGSIGPIGETKGFDRFRVDPPCRVSQLNAERNDGVIIGASSLEQLRHNLTAVTEGPLPTDVLTAIDHAAVQAQPKWPPYF
jgi:hypothetical protein